MIHVMVKYTEFMFLSRDANYVISLTLLFVLFLPEFSYSNIQTALHMVSTKVLEMVNGYLPKRLFYLKSFLKVLPSLRIIGGAF